MTPNFMLCGGAYIPLSRERVVARLKRRWKRISCGFGEIWDRVDGIGLGPLRGIRAGRRRFGGFFCRVRGQASFARRRRLKAGGSQDWLLHIKVWFLFGLEGENGFVW